MLIKVIEEPVRHNVELFQKVVAQLGRHSFLKPLASQKLFKLYVNKESGRISSEIQENHHAWKSIEISYLYDSKKGELSFYVEEFDKGSESFVCGDLNPQAYEIMSKTLLLINKISQKLTGPSDLQTKIDVIARLQLEALESQFERSILMKAWHPSDRLKAERLLWNKPIGTFLFRKDTYAALLEEQLQKQHGKTVKCFTLTYSQPGQKFSDLTLVHLDGTWFIYDDDPTLNFEQRYYDLKDLLDQMKDILKYPLYN